MNFPYTWTIWIDLLGVALLQPLVKKKPKNGILNMGCQSGYAKSYCNIVMGASVLLSFLGLVDIIAASLILHGCNYASNLIPLLINCLGVVTIYSGILVLYLLARETDVDFIFFTNVQWQSFRIAVWVLTGLTYLMGVIFLVTLEKVTDGVDGDTCSGARAYVYFHIFATGAVPFAPVLLAAFVLAVILFVFALYIACLCLECFCSSSND